MEWILLVFFILVVTLGAILLYRIPLRLTLCLINDDTISKGSVKVTWGITGFLVNLTKGNLQTELLVSGKTLYLWKEVPGDGIKDDDRFYETFMKTGSIRWLCRIPGWVLMIIRHIQVEGITGRIYFGLGDPVLTGFLYGSYRAILPLLPEYYSCDIYPVFEQAECTGTIEARICMIHPLDILVLVGIEVFSLILQEKTSFMLVKKPGADHA